MQKTRDSVFACNPEKPMRTRNLSPFYAATACMCLRCMPVFAWEIVVLGTCFLHGLSLGLLFVSQAKPFSPSPSGHRSGQTLTPIHAKTRVK